MPLRLQVVENAELPDQIVIDLDIRLIQGSVLMVTKGDDDDDDFRGAILEAAMPSIAEGLLGLFDEVTEFHGMERAMTCHRYCLAFEKGSMFSWKVLIPPIVGAVRTFLASDGIIEQVTEFPNLEGKSHRIADLIEVPEVPEVRPPAGQ